MCNQGIKGIKGYVPLLDPIPITKYVHFFGWPGGCSFINIICIISLLYINDTLDTLICLQAFILLIYKAGYHFFIDTLLIPLIPFY